VQAGEEDSDAVVDTEVRRMRAVVQCTTEDQQRTHTQLAVVQAELQQHLMELQQHLIELQQELQQHLPVHVSQQWHIPVISIKNPHAALIELTDFSVEVVYTSVQFFDPLAHMQLVLFRVRSEHMQLSLKFHDVALVQLVSARDCL
jgi:plasmid maintenance system killer protein